MNAPSNAQADDNAERGAVVPIVAICLLFLMTMTAFTVDLGRVMLRNRDAQAVADIVALDLARKVDGRTVDQIKADPAWGDEIKLSRERNNFAEGGSRYVGYRLGHVIKRTREFVEDSGSAIPNAVQTKK